MGAGEEKKRKTKESLADENTIFGSRINKTNVITISLQIIGP